MMLFIQNICSEYCERYAKPEDVSVEEEESDEELSDAEGYADDSGDDEVIMGTADP